MCRLKVDVNTRLGHEPAAPPSPNDATDHNHPIFTYNKVLMYIKCDQKNQEVRL